jgi:hypothetical protein
MTISGENIVIPTNQLVKPLYYPIVLHLELAPPPSGHLWLILWEQKIIFPHERILQGLHRIIFVWSTGHCYDHLGREHSNSYKPAGKATLLSFVLHLELEELNPD